MRHCPSTCHTHTVETFDKTASGSFTAPDHEFPSFLEIKLTATDSSGTQTTTSVVINPQTVALTLDSSPSGLDLGLDGSTDPTPFARTVIVNSRTTINAPTPQTLNGTTYAFSAWSDGGAASHTIRTPAVATT